MQKESALRLWLARHKPDKVRCTLRDGKTTDLPRPTMARGQWAHLERAILTLQPAMIEAMRGDVCVNSRSFDIDEEEQAPEEPQASAEENPLTVLVKVLPTIVQLIVDAGDASAERHQKAYELAFQKQLELVKILSDRLSGIERAWHKMILDRAAQQGEDNDTAAMSLLGQIVNGRQANGDAGKKGDE